MKIFSFHPTTDKLKNILGMSKRTSAKVQVADELEGTSEKQVIIKCYSVPFSLIDLAKSFRNVMKSVHLIILG